MRASSDAGSIRRVGIPPLLSIGVDPTVVWVLATSVVDIRATEVEPPNSLRARQDEFASCLNVLRKMQIAQHLDIDVGQIAGKDRCEDVVVYAYIQSDFYS